MQICKIIVQNKQMPRVDNNYPDKLTLKKNRNSNFQHLGYLMYN